MTAPQAKRLTLGILSALLVGILTPIILGAWHTKVDRSDFELYVQETRNWQTNHVLGDSARWGDVNRRLIEIQELQLEAFCELKPQSRKCR